MADEKMNDKEDEQCNQQSQASKETITSLNPVPVEEDPVAVAEGPVTEAPETDQQPIRNRRSSSPTGEEVEPEVKRARYAGGSSSDSNLDLPDLIKQLLPGIDSWLHSNITEFINIPPTTTLSIPGAPNPFKPPKPPIPPKPPRPPGSKLASSSVSNRLLKLETAVNNLKTNLNQTNEINEDLVMEVNGYEFRIQKLEAEVKKLKGGSYGNKSGLSAGIDHLPQPHKPATSVEKDSELEISDTDQQSTRNQQYRKITIIGPDPKGKRPMLDDGSSSDSTLQELSKIRTHAFTRGISIPGVSSSSRPPIPARTAAANPSPELGLHQRPLTIASGSSSQIPIPNVGGQSGAAGHSSGQQQSMQEGQFFPPTGALNLPTISSQSLHQLLEPDYITHRMLELENEVKNVKGVADLLLSELSNSNTRILILEDEVRTLKGGNQGLQKSSEGQTATDERNCGSGLAGAKVPFDKSIRTRPGSTSGKDDELLELLTTSGKDDESQEPVTTAAGDGVSTESDGSQDEKKDANTSQEEKKDDITS